ncbi:MAG: uridine diphosphate-N-acetylglucosamine-binding protein YvcK [Candidatus Omnitrophica bacterium]|nr:uridine diphosphate-N-acetylglucosamine-binding protein YvcK [Candidatus Omnitrophota bacterium]
MRLLIASSNPSLASLIRRSFERFHYSWVQVDDGIDAFQKIVSSKFDLVFLDFSLPRMNAPEVLRRLHSLDNFKMPPVLVLTLSEPEREQIEHEHFSQTEVFASPIAIREFVAKVQQILNQRIRVACLGGGTGLFTLLSGLKTISGITLSSIVSMSDDGGSTGVLRDMFGILPPGDIRRSLVALSTAPDLLNELMQYRFDKGKELKGHNIGNLLLTALIQMRGSMSNAVKSISEILNIQGEVIPVTESVNTLKAELENGKVIEGEHRINLFEGINPKIRINRLWQEPPVSATPDAIQALYNAHVIILGPGDLFTSVISNLTVAGISDAISSSKAKKIYICNVMTKPGETTDFQVSDHVREVIKYLKKDCLDYVLFSNTRFHKAALSSYASQNQIPVTEKNSKVLKKVTRAKILSADLASESQLVRHDSLKLASEIKKIIQKETKRESKRPH